MNDIQIKYPNKLKEHRIKSGYTQKQVAKMLQMQCEDRLSHWERGQAMPSVLNVLKLSKIYSAKVEEIYNFL